MQEYLLSYISSLLAVARVSG